MHSQAHLWIVEWPTMLTMLQLLVTFPLPMDALPKLLPVPLPPSPVSCAVVSAAPCLEAEVEGTWTQKIALKEKEFPSTKQVANSTSIT